MDIKTQYFIMAQGIGSRWTLDRRFMTELPAEYKWFIPLNGETIITRILRQLNDKNFVVVMSLSHAHLLPSGTPIYQLHEPTGSILRGIWTVIRKKWDADRFVFLLGDVVYSKRMLDVIFTNKDNELLFYGRNGQNEITGKEASEIFGISFGRSELENIEFDLYSIWKPEEENYNLKLWLLLRYVNGNMLYLPYDFTDDVDSPQGYLKFFKKLEKAAWEDEH